MSYCILDLYIVCRGVLPPNSFSYLLFWKFLLFWANIQLIFFFEVIESKERACIRNRTSNKLYFYLNNVTFLLAICKHGNMKWLGNKITKTSIFINHNVLSKNLILVSKKNIAPWEVNKYLGSPKKIHEGHLLRIIQGNTCHSSNWNHYSYKSTSPKFSSNYSTPPPIFINLTSKTYTPL